MAGRRINRMVALSHRLSILGPRGNTLSVVAQGEGPTLILVHGFPLDHRLWLSQVEALSKTHKVLCPELRGFGDSQLIEPQYSIADLADDLEKVRQHFAPNEKVALCGLSMGGYVAFEYWARHGQNLSHLILANTKPNADGEQGRAGRLAMAQTAMENGTVEALGNMVDKLVASGSSETIRNAAIEMMQSVPPQTIAAAQTAMSQRNDFAQRLKEIDVPTLVITGCEDSIAPPTATQAWANQIASSNLSVLENSAHLTPVEAPEAFNTTLLSFLNA